MCSWRAEGNSHSLCPQHKSLVRSSMNVCWCQEMRCGVDCPCCANRHVTTLAALNACVRDTVAQACTVQGGCVFCRAVQQRGKDRHLMTVGAHTETSRCVPLTWTFAVIVTTWTTERDKWRKWSENISFYYVSVIKKKKLFPTLWNFS